MSIQLNERQKIILVGIMLVSALGYFYLQNRNAKQEVVSTNTIQKDNELKTTVLVGTLKQISPSIPVDPVEYVYELILDKPFYDELQASGQPNMTKVPLLSRDESIQESMKGYIGKKVTVEGSMEWGYSESRFLNISSINIF